MTSSLRNSVHRRNHKERSQLAHRAKLGFLEKHSDYVKRARDYHSKQDRLTRLKQKVAERNKDEFYFSMTKERTREGVHIKDRGNVAIPTDMVKVLKTQDENYVRTMRASGLKKIDKIKNQLTEMADLVHAEEEGDNNAHLDEHEVQILKKANILSDKAGSFGKKRKHLLFAENVDEVTRLTKNGKVKEVVGPTSPSSVAEIDLGWKTVEPRAKPKRKTIRDQANNNVSTGLSEESKQSHLDKRKRLLKELSARLDRDRQLRYTLREFEMQRQLMGKGGRKKVLDAERVDGDDEENEDEIDARRGKRRKASSRHVDEETYKPRVYKWRLERKR